MATASLPSATSIQTIQVQGGNLFQIAAFYLGDATQWNRIAVINDLSDFILPAGVGMTLKLPPKNPTIDNSGVIGV